MQNVVERYIRTVMRMGLTKQKSDVVNHTHAMEAVSGLSNLSTSVTSSLH